MTLKKLPVAILVTLLSTFSAQALTAAAYEKKSKLVVVLVIDQFRSDLLTNRPESFLPPGTPAAPGGFRYLTHQGAFFPFAEYDILQAMTCTGHAMILTGSHPEATGIGTNEWFDPKLRRNVYCAEDAEYGLSPRRLRTTTVGDELKNVREKSRVVAVAGKDRSAIMLGGHRADIALWLHDKETRWVTSDYYNKGELPAWVKPINDRLMRGSSSRSGKENVEGAIEITGLTLDLAIEALKKEKLGRGADPDVLAISLSYHDIIGHMFGPNSKEIRDVTLAEDRLISGFLKKLRQEMGTLDDVVIAFTADHGTPPASDLAKSFKLDTGRFEFLPVIRKINQRLDEKFGSAGKKEWVLGFRLFHFFLNPEVLADKKLDGEKVAAEVKTILLGEPGILDVFTKYDHANGRFPVGPVGTQLRHSYIPGQSGDLVVVAKPFFYEKGGNPVTHMTGWSYDRSVPLILVGRNFKPGVYPGGLVIDLAPTLSFVLGVLAPAKNEGRVLGEALR